MRLIAFWLIFITAFMIEDKIVRITGPNAAPIAGSVIAALMIACTFGLCQIRKTFYFPLLTGALGYSLINTIGPVGAFRVSCYGAYIVAVFFIKQSESSNGNYK